MDDFLVLRTERLLSLLSCYSSSTTSFKALLIESASTAWPSSYSSVRSSIPLSGVKWVASLIGGRVPKRPWKMGRFFLTLEMRWRSFICSSWAASSWLFLIEPLFENNRLAKAWFSRSMRSFSWRLMVMLRLFGLNPSRLMFWLALRFRLSVLAILALDCWWATELPRFLIALGPWTEDHLPWLMSTSLLSRIWLCLLRRMFCSKLLRLNRYRFGGRFYFAF